MSRLPAALTLALGLLALTLAGLRPAVQAGTPTPAPTCPPSTCPQPRVGGVQPPRTAMLPAFRRAARNALGTAGPPYDAINVGLPPALVTQPVSAANPLPLPLLLAVAWQESRWIQFGDTVGASEGAFACTLLSPDCGYGVMQITSCMSDGCGWFDPLRVAAEYTYNLGTGANFLIRKWNHAPFLGQNDPAIPEEWYFAVLAYNGWSTCNDPNRTTPAAGCPVSTPFAPDRPPYHEGDYRAFAYPYQEYVWGWMATDVDDLWRGTRVPPVPRGVFGLRRPGSWTPPSRVPRPQTTLLAPLWVSGTQGSLLWLHNTTPVTQAADVLLYNPDDTFNRRWLGAPPNAAHLYPLTGIRIAPSATLTIPLSEAFYPWESFQGYARVETVQGVEAALVGRVYLPLVAAGPGARCAPALVNGGFEKRTHGQPTGWEAFSAGGFPLADATSVHSGHLSAHLGGVNAAHDVLSQTLTAPASALTATLRLWWRVDSLASPTDADRFTLTLAGPGFTPTVFVLTTTATTVWQPFTAQVVVSAPVTATLRLEAITDAGAPTHYYLDDVYLGWCMAP